MTRNSLSPISVKAVNPYLYEHTSARLPPHIRGRELPLNPCSRWLQALHGERLCAQLMPEDQKISHLALGTLPSEHEPPRCSRSIQELKTRFSIEGSSPLIKHRELSDSTILDIKNLTSEQKDALSHAFPPGCLTTSRRVQWFTLHYFGRVIPQEHLLSWALSHKVSLDPYDSQERSVEKLTELQYQYNHGLAQDTPDIQALKVLRRSHTAKPGEVSIEDTKYLKAVTEENGPISLKTVQALLIHVRLKNVPIEKLRKRLSKAFVGIDFHDQESSPDLIMKEVQKEESRQIMDLFEKKFPPEPLNPLNPPDNDMIS